MMSSSDLSGLVLDAESAVRDRYSSAAEEREAELCCPVDYDAQYLKVIPQEVIDRDYGCGDPSKYVSPGETVLDLGCGGGKICFIAAQKVGEHGRVIGVDMNDEMLELAKSAQPKVADAIGFSNVRFVKAKIQDMALDRDVIDAYLKENPVNSEADLRKLEAHEAKLRKEKPLVANDSVDVVVSNCVLNLVDPEDKQRLFREIYRVLKPGGRAVISDIVSDTDVPVELQNDPELWSGCISGAFEERDFLYQFQQVGFDGLSIAALGAEPWRLVEGIEFRSMTVIAHKPCESEDSVGVEAFVYKGPFETVVDDNGNVYHRGERVVAENAPDSVVNGPLGEQFATIGAKPTADASTGCCSLEVVTPPSSTGGCCSSKEGC